MSAARKSLSLRDLIKQVVDADGQENYLLKEKFLTAILAIFEKLLRLKATNHTSLTEVGQSFAEAIYKIEIDPALQFHRELVVKHLGNNLHKISNVFENDTGNLPDVSTSFKAKAAEIVSPNQALLKLASEAKDCKIVPKFRMSGSNTSKRLSAPAAMLSALGGPKKADVHDKKNDDKKKDDVVKKPDPNAAALLAAKFKTAAAVAAGASQQVTTGQQAVQVVGKRSTI